MPDPTTVAIVGGGVSGLAAALAVREQLPDADIVVFEASPAVGGKLRVDEIAGVQVDVGAEAMLARRPEGRKLIAAAGLDDAVIAPTTTAALLYAGGGLHPLPARTMMGVPGDIEAVRASGALSADGLAALAAEPGRPPLPPIEHDVAVGALVRERMGDEVADRLVEPLLGGVYAGRADELSLRATMPALAARLAGGGSLLAATAAVTDVGTYDPSAGPVFASIAGGMGLLPQRLAATGLFTVRTSTTVRAIRRTAGGFELECGPVPDAEFVTADAVIVATPPSKAARLLAGLADAAAADLATIETASMAITTLAYRDVDLPAGSGVLVGAREGLTVKAVTLSTQKWPMATDGLTVLRASVGRAGEPQVLQREDGEIVKLVRHELRSLIGVHAEPVDAIVTRWGGGLPQYTVGHVEKVARIRASVADVPGLAVCGAAFDGVGIPACIASAHSAAVQALAALQLRGQ